MTNYCSPRGLLLGLAASAALVAQVGAQDPNHRWTFNNTLVDSGVPGGSDAQLTDPDGNPGTGGGSTQTATNITLAGGGNNESDFIDLGSGLLSTAPGPVTVELWATQNGVQNWSRVVDFGNRNGNDGEDYLFISWSIGTDPNADRVEWREVTPDIGGSRFVDNSNAPYTLGTEYHIALNVRPGAGAGGQTLVEWYSAPSGASDLGAAKGSFSTPNTLASLNDVNGWLGRSQWAGDATASATYNEARIFYRKMDPAELEAFHDLGPDSVTHVDADNDGLPAWWENKYGLSDNDDGTTDHNNGPTGNPDGDSADNAAELASCTDPTNPLSNPNDTDADGLDDAWEIANFGSLDSGPSDDPDRDGVDNESEETAGTDPNDKNSFPDSDGDGLPDPYELANWGDLTTSDGSTDSDGDTYSDLEEYLAGTDPTNGAFSPNKAQLRHRWSFNGDLVDSAGSSDAQILDADNNAGTGGLSDLTTNPGEVRLFGGVNAESNYVLLGNSLVGGTQHDLTIELWGTQHGVANWSRVFSFGSGNGDVSSVLMQAWTRGTNLNESRIEWRSPQFFIDTNEAPAVYPLGVEHHIVVQLDNRGDGTTQVTLYKNPSGNADLGPLTATSSAPVSLADLVDNVNWLGRSQFGGDPTANASYNEVRIWDGLVNPKVLEVFHDQGADDASLLDTDGDCLPDFWEIANGLSETDASGDNGAFGDPDGDGVINRDEYARCTDPLNADSDGDGYSDSEEHFWNTDPNDGTSKPSPWAQNLCGYWPMEDDFLDTSSTGAHGTGMNAPGFTAGMFGQGVNLVKSSHQYVQIDQVPASTFTIDGNGVDDGAGPEAGDLSISAWFNTGSGFTQDWQGLIAKGEGADYRVARRGGANVLGYAGGTGDIPTSDIGPNVNDGGMHHVVAITEDGVSTRLWVDGTLVATGGVPNLTPNGDEDFLLIGGNPDGNEGDTNENQFRTWNGVIDDVAVWKRVLTESEVLAVYNQGLDGRALQFLITNPDTDGDGLLDVDEINGTFGYVTDPFNPDTDGDGVDDRVEILKGSNPTVNDDSDGDGINNLEETSGSGNAYDGAPTDPCSTDSDGDGIPDGEEVSAGADGYITNPNSGDTDGDGHGDAAEVAAGSDPTDPGSVPPVNLALYYTFDQIYKGDVCNQGTLLGSGTVLGTDDGGGFFTPGQANYGQALLCNRGGSNDVRVATSFTSAELGFQSGNATFMAWVLWNGPLGQEDHMIFGNPTADSIHYGIRANNNGVDDGHFGTWGGDIGDAGTIPIGAWTHMTFVQDGATGRVYINGVQAAAAGYGINANTGPKEVWIGVHPNGGLNSFNGAIDEVKVFDRALVPQEVVAAMNALPPALPVPANDLEAWRLHYFGTVTNTGNAADDADPNGNGIPNILQWIYGLNPTADGAAPVVDADVPTGTLTAPGVPRADVQTIPNGVNFCVIYTRNVNAAALGLAVDVEFSSDLMTWFPNTGGETILATDGEVELVKVTYPFFLPNGRKARFFHVVVSPL